jgi:hypothetical protein
MKFFVALAGALALASAAEAATYDAFASFDGTQGAGGFIYLKVGAIPGAPASPLTSGSTCVVTSDFCLQDNGGLPGAYKSLTSFSEGTYTVPDDRLLMHPGSANPIAILFAAPKAGEYDYLASFDVLDRSPSGVFVMTLTNAGGTVAATPAGLLNAQNLGFTRSGSITLAKGEIFGFILNNGGNYSNDSTGVSFRLHSADVPEPASWALMIAGFGLAGTALRRRVARA